MDAAAAVEGARGARFVQVPDHDTCTPIVVGQVGERRQGAADALIVVGGDVAVEESHDRVDDQHSARLVDGQGALEEVWSGTGG